MSHSKHRHDATIEATQLIKQTSLALLVCPPSIRTDCRTGFAIVRLGQCISELTQHFTPSQFAVVTAPCQLGHLEHDNIFEFALQNLKRAIESLSVVDGDPVSMVWTVLQQIHADLQDLKTHLETNSYETQTEADFVQRVSEVVY